MQQFSGWNNQVLEDKQRSGKIKSYTHSPKNIPHKNGKNIPARSSKEKTWLAWNLAFWCNEHAVTLETEYQFDKFRKWKFDWCIPALMIALEYEGIFSAKSRHTTISGFTGDVEKYNAAQALGWRIIRLTAKDYKTVLQQLNEYAK